MVDREIRRAVIVAGLAVASQVASKAARDGVFLGTFDATMLPRAMMVTAVLSILAVAAMSAATRRFGPRRTVPVLFFISALLFLFEAALLGRAPRLGAALIFGHVSCLGALVLSGFWSLIAETFDARKARASLGIVGTGATFGGLAGGLGAERMSALFGIEALLIVLAVTQLGAAVLLNQVRGSTDKPVRDSSGAGLREIAGNRYLVNLALLVVVLACAGGLLDFLLKSSAAARFEDPRDITRFFAAFYAGAALLAFILQASIGRRALERFGLAKTAFVLPILVFAGGVGFVAVPGLLAAGFGRGSEMVMRTSLYKNAYELFFAPLSTGARNRLKSWIDVGFERVGDALSGGLVQLLLLTAAAPRLIAASAALLAGLAIVVIVRLARGYVSEIEKRLDSKTKALADAPATMTTMATLGLGGLDLSRVLASNLNETSSGAPPKTLTSDRLDERVRALHSDDVEVVRQALQAPLEAALVPVAIQALSRDSVALAASEALAKVASHHAGQLLDALLDPDEPLSTRRRIPRILATAPSERIRAGLLVAVRDRRFEVRVRAAEALYQIRKSNGVGSDPISEELLAELIQIELKRSGTSRLTGPLEVAGMRTVVPGEAPQVYFLFLLVALAHPPAMVGSAFRASMTGDEKLRGLGLEYLANVTPSVVRDQLLARLDSLPLEPTASLDQLECSLLASQVAIDVARRDHESR